ncbi:MAG TPA: MASE1 domain-containing protein [Candidatus Acidoferrum sp.]|nr:MASE1 domain-containing protein [Candidatus Acidoferrum sp.]
MPVQLTANADLQNVRAPRAQIIWSPSANKQTLHRILVMFGIAVVYFLAGRLALKLAVINPSVSSVWPPTGIALAALLIFGYEMWPAILFAAFGFNISTTGPHLISLIIAAGNTLEALVGAYLIRRLAHGRWAFASAEDVLKFAFLGGVVCTTIPATIGVASLSAAGLLAAGQREAVWFTWWLGDMIGAIVVAPCILLWVERPPMKRGLRERVRGGAAAGSLLLLGLLLFSDLIPFRFQDYRLAFLCIPLIVWGAFYLRPHEGITLVLALSAIAVWGTLRGFGGFSGTNVNASLLLLQAFMGVIAVTSLVLSAAISERNSEHAALERARDELEARVVARTTELQDRIATQERAEEAMRDLSSRLMKSQDDERRRIARELHDSTGQDLAWLSMSLSQLRREAEKRNAASPGKISEMLEIVQKVLAELRTISYLLHPPLLDDMGLSSAIRWLVDGFVERSKVQVSIDIPEGLERFSPELETAVFRVVQECLTNIHRHSASTTASIRLERTAEALMLEVSDRGRGIPEEKVPGATASGVRGLGLRGMRERVRQFGGEIEIVRLQPGTLVRMELPVRATRPGPMRPEPQRAKGQSAGSA